MVSKEKASSKAGHERVNNDWRKKIFNIIEPMSRRHRASEWYDRGMVAVTLLSFVPLMFHNELEWPFIIINTLCAIVFISDYLMRLITSDYRYKKSSVWSFIRYLFSFSAIVDFVVILSVITGLYSGFRLLRIARLLHVVRIFQHSRSFQLIKIVLKRATRPLLFVASVALVYIFIVATLIFNEEPELFPSFVDALYWAVISLSTIGYGDFVPATEMGRIITMISAIVGLAVFALPTSVITAEYVSVINEYREGKIDGEHHQRRFEVDETELISDVMKSKKERAN